MNKISLFIVSAVAAAAAVSCAKAPALTQSGLDPEAFKTEINGAETGLWTLTNANGMEVCITNFGGRIVSIMVPDKDGVMRDVVHGFDNIQDYIDVPSDFGAAIGRYANRIANGHFTLDGVEYTLPQNNNGHTLHGGPKGWQYAVYEVLGATEDKITLQYVSPDGEMGFPGTVKAQVDYTLTEDNRIIIDYLASTDKPTVVNMTNHSYFNLSGDPTHTIEDNVMYINSSFTTPADSLLIPTGEIAPVEGTPFDFRTPKSIAPSINTPDNDQLAYGRGFDHNWVLDGEYSLDKLAASVMSPVSGIKLDIYTTEPGIQVYCGNFLDGTVTGKHGTVYQHRTAVCLESQHYPDSPNKPEFPSTVLRPDGLYATTTIFAFGIEK